MFYIKIIFSEIRCFGYSFLVSVYQQTREHPECKILNSLGNNGKKVEQESLHRAFAVS